MSAIINTPSIPNAQQMQIEVGSMPANSEPCPPALTTPKSQPTRLTSSIRQYLVNLQSLLMKSP